MKRIVLNRNWVGSTRVEGNRDTVCVVHRRWNCMGQFSAYNIKRHRRNVYGGTVEE